MALGVGNAERCASLLGLHVAHLPSEVSETTGGKTADLVISTPVGSHTPLRSCMGSTGIRNADQAVY